MLFVIFISCVFSVFLRTTIPRDSFLPASGARATAAVQALLREKRPRHRLGPERERGFLRFTWYMENDRKLAHEPMVAVCPRPLCSEQERLALFYLVHVIRLGFAAEGV